MKQKNTVLTEKTSFEAEKMPEMSADLLLFFANPKGFLQAVLKELVHDIHAALPNNAPAPTHPPKEYIGLETAYELYLKEFYSKSYIYNLVNKGAIPHGKIGKKIVFDVPELLEWIKSGRYDYGKAEREKIAIEYLQQTP